MKSRLILYISALALVLAATCALLWEDKAGAQEDGPAAREVASKERASASRPQRADSVVDDFKGESEDEGESAEGDGEPRPEVEPQTEEERRQDAEEKLVDDFDALTDKWMEPMDGGVSMKDIDAFAERFRSVPASRKEECLQRALNLVPDENVMLLVGILMDKSQDKELVELIFNDVLNRDEEVKAPILQQIFKDKEHPCWADTAWILDVTGEAPKQKE